MRRIMFVIGVLSNGGAERVISLLAKELCDMGCEVSILTIYGDKNDYVFDKRIKLYPLVNTKSKIMKSVSVLRETRKLIKKINADIVISFVAIINIYTILANVNLKTKLIVSERNDPYQNPENKYMRKLRDILYKFADGYVFQTNDAKKYFSYPIQSKGVIISNPLKQNLPYWNEETNSKTIITASRLVKQKNLTMLISAFSKFQNEFPAYKLKIYGVGELRIELLDLIKGLGLEEKINLPGFSTNIHHEMVNSEMFVLSSDYEGISNSMLEALAIGVPVISTDSPIGGAKKFIRSGENGLLIKVGDTEGLYSAMKSIASDREYAVKLSKESRKVRNELSSEVIVKQWLDYIDEICGGRDA